jgi:DNA polymerase delta subunit 1
MTETLTLHAYSWTVEDKYTEDDHVAIHAWALDQKSNSHLIRIVDFPAFCHVELPYFVNGHAFHWDEGNVDRYYQWLCQMLRDHAPEKYLFKRAPKVYYHRGNRTYPMLLLTFRSLAAMDHCEKFLSKPWHVDGLGMVMSRVWETQVSIVRKLLTIRNCKYSQWFKIEATRVDDDDKIAIPEVHEYIGNWRSLTPISSDETKGWITKPTLLAFDIECYSPNHKAMPNELHAKHVAYMISLIYQEIGNPETRERYGLVIGDCDEITLDETRPGAKEGEVEQVPGDKKVKIIKCANEVELINKMSELVNQLDPLILSGYNIFSFDYPYLDARLSRRLKEWMPMGRIMNKATTMTSFNWNSGAYGHNSINYLQMDGRISIDVHPLIRRDYKLDKYTLDFVSKYFLGQHRGKHDVSPQEMFQIYEESTKAANIVNDQRRKGLEPDQAMLDEYTRTKGEMTKVMAYCIEDSELVVDLFDRLNVWIALVELSNIVGVEVMDLFTRGQQVRGLSQFYDLAARQGYVLDSRENIPVKFSGGFVYEPIPGLYENIICLDFASLYPSIIQAFNICPTTLIPPELMDKIPDEDCHVFDFDQDEDGDVDEEEDLFGEGEKPKNKKGKKTVHRHYKYIKQDIREGIVPRLVRNLVAERRAVRNHLDGVKDPVTGEWIVEKEKDPMIRVILDKRQLALKVTANSFFGLLGVQEGGKLPLIEGAMCITAKGRELINTVNKYLQDKYGAIIVYNDTDSSMVDLHIKDPKEAVRRGIELAKEVSDLFPDPLKMEFEKAMRLLCIRKKMYAAALIDKEGNHNLNPDKVMKKGILPARRDKCKWVRKHYIHVLMNILTKKSIVETFDYLVDAIKELLAGNVDYKDLLVIRELGAHYKNDGFCMKVFADYLRRHGKIVNPGDRLEYLIVKGDVENVGPRMRSPELYAERRGTAEQEDIDYTHYIDKVMTNPIDQLFRVGFKDELEKLTGVGYKPNRGTFKPITDPVKMLSYMVKDGLDIEQAKKLIRPRPVALKVVDPQQPPQPRVILKIIQNPNDLK